MLAVSAGFLQAIKNKAPQDVRLEFTGGDVIGTSDIAITSGGLTYTEILNGETDVTFGRAVMSELSVTLVNADGRFTDFDFAREFTAKVGVKVALGAKVTHSGTQVSWTDEAAGYTFTYWVYSTTAIRFQRQAIGSNTSTATSLSCSNAAIVITYNDMVYAVGADYNIIKVWRRTSPTSHGVIMVSVGLPAGITDAQLKSWVDSKTCVRVEEQGDGFVYVPLGVFKGERPEKVRGKLINFTAHDRMSLFDKPAEAFADGLTFPCTLGQIYTKLCDFCGAGYVSAEFPNSGKTFDANPLEDTDYTCREILGYIAEAAGSYARMSRDGAVELVWFAAADYTVTRTDRFEMTESEFLTPPIDRLEVYNSYGDQLNSSGTGDIVYGISDNPFLYIENDTQLTGLQPYVDAIYNRITSLPAYHSSSFRAEFNPAVQCGDIISVVDDYGETISFPVFVLTLTWNGGGKTVYENTGGVIRQNAPFTQRELEQIKKKSVKTKDLWTYVDSYLSSPEGVASINAAVGGNFVTKDDLTGFVTETQLNVAVEAYINGEEGIAKLTESLSGTFVTVREYGNNITLTATSQMFVQAEDSDGYSPSSITLTANTDGNLTFAWYKDGTLLSGKTAKTLTVYPADIADSSATYKVVGTDKDGKTYSDQMSVAKLREGKEGADGASGYTMVLSNEYIEVPVTEKRIPKTARTYSCVVSVYSGTTKMTAVTGTPAAGQFKLTTPAGVTGITVSQSPAGTVKLTVSTETAIGDINEFEFNVTIYGGVTLPAKITMTANMNDVAAGAYEVTSNIDSRIEQYISGEEGVAAITSAVSGKFVTSDDLGNYVQSSELNTSIKQYINGEEGVAAITTVVSGKYATKDEASSMIEQSVNGFGASLKLSVTNGQKSSTISLTGNGINLSGKVEFNGEVVFKSDLSTKGSTTINGDNITSGKISAKYIDVGELSTKKVIFSDDNYNFNVISSDILSENNARVTVGLTDYIKSDDFGQYLNLYGTQIYMIHTGYDLAAGDSDNYSLLFDMANQRIKSGSNNWTIGQIDPDSEIYDVFGNACFGDLYTQRIYCSGRIRMGAWGEDYPLLRNVDGELRWYTANSEYTVIA